jgi:hypothetical protein
MISPGVNPCFPAPQSSCSGLKVADGQSEADKAMEWLQWVGAATRRQAALMPTDADLGPIGARPEFQLLIMDLVWPVDPFARPD